MESRKIIIFRTPMVKQTQRTDLWTRRERGGTGCIERVTWKFTIPYIK